MAQGKDTAARKLPGSLETNRRLDRWLRINADGTVTVMPGKVEIGQGILTALVQMVAEELDIDVARIRLLPASTAFSPDEGITQCRAFVTAKIPEIKKLTGQIKTIETGPDAAVRLPEIMDANEKIKKTSYRVH